jgi:hypothetical protein
VRGELSQAHLLDQLHAAGMASQAGWLTFRCTVPACARMASAAAPNCIGRTAERVGTVVAIVGAMAAGEGTKPG